jgi:hypothetical protein
LEALQDVDKKFEKILVDSNEVTLEQLEIWETVLTKNQNAHSGLLPIARKVFATTYNTELNECNIIREVKGQDDFVGRTYRYYYYPSKKGDARISVEMEKDLVNNKIIGYWYDS